MKTTLNQIREHSPCAEGWETLLRSLNKTKADDEPVSIVQVLDSNGLDDALWCLRAVKGYDREIRLFAVWCARQVEHLMTDERSKQALVVAERHANGEATDAELAAAGDAAWDAAGDAARAAARDAARAAARDAQKKKNCVVFALLPRHANLTAAKQISPEHNMKHIDEHDPEFEPFQHHVRRSHMWEFIMCTVFAVVALIATALALLAPEDARAQDVPTWEKLNESCQSAPEVQQAGKYKPNPDCAARNKLSSQMVRTGWEQANHGVWLSPDQLQFAGKVISKYDRQLSANMSEFDSLMPAQLLELRTKLTDAQIFAIWRLRQDAIRANAPYAGAMLDETIARLAVHYARSGDPRLSIGY